MSAPIQHLLSIPMCGLPCSFCGQPVRLITVYPRGIRTVRKDATQPFCDHLPPPTKPRPGTATAGASSAPPPGPAPVRLPVRPGHQLNRESRCA